MISNSVRDMLVHSRDIHEFLELRGLELLVNLLSWGSNVLEVHKELSQLQIGVLLNSSRIISQVSSDPKGIQRIISNSRFLLGITKFLSTVLNNEGFELHLRCTSKLHHAIVHLLFCLGNVTEIKPLSNEIIGIFHLVVPWVLNLLQQGSSAYIELAQSSNRSTWKGFEVEGDFLKERRELLVKVCGKEICVYVLSRLIEN
jgi:hypothetical protein